tara:strand:- start:1415 stop:1804 length:390 start_codon:yes stop_codon:yes gene_type:complete
MGLFSYPCQRCGRSILSEYSAPHGWLMHATVRTEEGKIIDGIYDGYGRLLTDEYGEFELPFPFSEEDRKWRIWHTECYHMPDNRLDQPPEPKDAHDQGYFLIEKHYEFSSASVIKNFYHPQHSCFSGLY